VAPLVWAFFTRDVKTPSNILIDETRDENMWQAVRLWRGTGREATKNNGQRDFGLAIKNRKRAGSAFDVWARNNISP
jgi:hypothetical protein